MKKLTKSYSVYYLVVKNVFNFISFDYNDNSEEKKGKIFP